MPNQDVRILVPGDEPLLEAFLLRHAASSMFLRSNVRAAGLVDRGERLQGTYAGSFVGHGPARAIVAVAAHAWNGLVLVQAPERDLAAVVAAATRASGREVRGFAGPWAQVEAARAVLGLSTKHAQLESREDLFTLELDRMAAPALLSSPGVIARPAAPSDLDVIAAFRHDYMVEALHATPSSALESAAREEMRRMIEDGAAFVLTVDDEVRAFSGFNARLPDVVQIGGVFTPVALRGRGYARAIVAATLQRARREGVMRALLFTDRHNVAARRAYVALGFEPIGDYGIVMF